MADGTHDIHQEYWRPLNTARNLASDPLQRDATCACGTEYLLGARFCHVCGSSREPGMGLKAHHHGSVAEWLDFDRIRDRTGLSTVSLSLYAIGVLCAVAAIFSGWIRDTSTVAEMRAAQMWRIELLLGSAVAFLAAIAAKRGS